MAEETKKITLVDKEEAGAKIRVFQAWCKKCGICVAFCPTGALISNQEGLPILAYPEKCTLCGICELRCPDFAIAVKVREKEEPKSEK